MGINWYAWYQSGLWLWRAFRGHAAEDSDQRGESDFAKKQACP
jgi:hypothetical protein